MNESEIINLIKDIIQDLPKYGESAEDLIYQKILSPDIIQDTPKGTVLGQGLYIIVPNITNTKNIRSRYIKPNPYNSIFYVK